jgi:response regulator RpfG family c-di-GMP phosphodiesterase
MASQAVAAVVCGHHSLGFDGIDFLVTVQGLYGNTARIMVSTCSDPAVLVQAVNRAAVHRYLIHPCDPGQVHEAVRAAVRQQRKERESRLACA